MQRAGASITDFIEAGADRTTVPLATIRPGIPLPLTQVEIIAAFPRIGRLEPFSSNLSIRRGFVLSLNAYHENRARNRNAFTLSWFKGAQSGAAGPPIASLFGVGHATVCARARPSITSPRRQPDPRLFLAMRGEREEDRATLKT
jgi:hypothetical protein